MRIHRFASAGLFAALIGTASAIAEQAGSTNPHEQTTYQTKGIILDANEIARWAGASYWGQKLGEVFRVAVDTRMQNDAEERDAVLATVWQAATRWQVKPEAIKAERRVFALIPQRPTKPQSKDIAYQITFLPRESAQEKDRVEARFVSEGSGARPIVANSPSLHLTAQLPRVYSYAGFPQNNNISQYWAEHPRPMNAILNWVASSNNANPAFDLVLSADVPGGYAASPVYFHVAGTKVVPSGPITSLRIEFLSEEAPVTPARYDVFVSTTAPLNSYLPAHDDARDFADLQIEKIQTETEAQERDKLGAITGLAELPADERLPAKFAIWQYFKNGTRNAEIDAIAPIPNTDRRALLTLRFDASSNVSVQQIGVDRKGSILGQLGDVRRVNGFAANSADVPALMAWLKKRYPAVTPKGTTVTELVTNATAEIQSKSGTPAWFKDNYGIDILAASAAPGQLTRSFQYKDQQLVDLEDFTASELQVLEVVFEKMGDHLVSRFKGLQMARQKTSVELIGVTATKLAVDDPHEAGVAVFHGSGRLIVIFDSAHLNSEALFVGGLGADGKPEIAAATLMAFAHELGHIVAAMPGAKEAFDGLVRTKNIKPVTWYAASNPKSEFFAEAFALYLGDPEWLKTNRPDLFSWFETFSRG